MTQDGVIQRLEEARARTLELIEPLSEDDLRRQHDPLMSPILWDLGHIAHFEALWLLRDRAHAVPDGGLPGMYDPFVHPRRSRGSLPLPSLAGCLRSMAEIRARVLDRVALEAFAPDDPLSREGYVYAMVLQHEYQHDETILQTLQLKQGAPYTPRRRRPPPAAAAAVGTAGSPTPSGVEHGAMARFPGGVVRLGTDDRAAAYDNERPCHEALVGPFAIDVHPVTNGDVLEFIREGGYQHSGLWSPEGREWLAATQATAPKYWVRDGADWCVRVMDRYDTVPLDRPVCHVCFHEAQAFARFAGKRLPTEQEWEVAAGWDPAAGTMRPFPWDGASASDADANLDQLAFDTTPAGAYGSNWSPLGCYGLIGDVWEWTASEFRPYPGYQMFPYPEYSEVFFGAAYRVLRGGSWATRPGAIRNSFRNWDLPERRQIFSGFRCARDD